MNALTNADYADAVLAASQANVVYAMAVSSARLAVASATEAYTAATSAYARYTEAQAKADALREALSNA